MTHVLRRMIAAVIALAGAATASDHSWQPLGPVSQVRKLSNGVELVAGKAAIRVTAVHAGVIRVRVSPTGAFPGDHSWAVLPEAVQNPPKVEVSESSANVEFSLRAGRVQIQKSPLLVNFLDSAGKVLLADDRPMAYSRDAFRVWKAMDPDEHYYGLGDKAGSMDHRGQAYSMWNTDAVGWEESTDPLYKSIPFFLAMRHGVSYGVFLDNTWRTSFDMGKASRTSYSFGAEGGELDYYFFLGPHPKKVLELYTALLGRSPLPPLWTLGYQQSRWSYYPESKVREIAAKLREDKIPADVIYLDIDYQKDNAPFTIDRERFPTFEQMIHDLGLNGFKVIAITDLHIKKQQGYKPYDEGMAQDNFVKNPDGSVYVGKVWPGDSVFPDFTLACARRWWGTLYNDFVSMGVAGFWNDMNEPSVFDGPGKTMPLDVQHRVDWGGSEPHRAIHNVYGMENVRATYDGLRTLRPNERAFVLTRAAYAGAQRYAATWTGDNTASWNHLRMMMPTLISLGMSGYPIVGADIGGFAGSPPADLLTRWFEVGAFTPIFRDHTAKGTKEQEPWAQGPEHEAIRRKYVELRYRLLPYIYTSVEETTRTGVPLMRPVFLEYLQAEEFYRELDNSYLPVYLFGRDLLVAPKVVEMVDDMPVTLPPGLWYDYWTGQPVQGGKEFVLDVPLDGLPLYARAGSIIPHQPLVQSTSEKPNGPLQLRVYPGPDCNGSIYLDDGTSMNYQKGDYLRVKFSCEQSARTIRVKISPAEGRFIPWWTDIDLQIYGAASQPKQVTSGGDAVQGWKYDANSKLVTAVITAAPNGSDVVVQY
jgi:alpha-glucosidase